ncbi:hypothetical protein FHS81_003289, partial [Pseudochelatococcus contaminans]|nr:hypothetical protein [Pseudochelatococcus contaminans]
NHIYARKPLFGLMSALTPIHETWKNDNLIRDTARSLSIAAKKSAWVAPSARQTASETTDSPESTASETARTPVDPRGGRR